MCEVNKRVGGRSAAPTRRARIQRLAAAATDRLGLSSCGRRLSRAPKQRTSGEPAHVARGANRAVSKLQRARTTQAARTASGAAPPRVPSTHPMAGITYSGVEQAPAEEVFYAEVQPEHADEPVRQRDEESDAGPKPKKQRQQQIAKLRAQLRKEEEQIAALHQDQQIRELTAQVQQAQASRLAQEAARHETHAAPAGGHALARTVPSRACGPKRGGGDKGGGSGRRDRRA